MRITAEKKMGVYTKKCNCTHKNMSTTNCKQKNERTIEQTNKQTNNQASKQASKHVCKRAFLTFYQGTAIPKLEQWLHYVGLRYWLSLLGKLASW